MQECIFGNAPSIHAEVDSMGGVVDNGVRIRDGSSLQRAAIEKAQADLKWEYDVREERRRELEYLEKGGNPLDFNFGDAASVSVQSTSLTGQPPEQLLTSEAKCSFAFTASPRGDSVESSGRPEAPVVSEPNCADNLLLFDGKKDAVGAVRNSVHFVRSKIAPLEQTSEFDSSHNTKESGKSAVLGLPKSRAYKRRNRSRPNREGARSSSTDMVLSRGDHASSLPSRPGQKDVEGSGLDADNQQNQIAPLHHSSKLTMSNGTIAQNDLSLDGVVDMVLDNGQAVEYTTGSTKVGLPKLVPHSENGLLNSQRSEDVAEEHSAVAAEIPESIAGREQVASAKPDNQTGSVQQNGFLDANGDEGRVLNKSQSCSATVSTKALGSEYYCTGTSFSLDPTIDSIPSNGLRNDNLVEKTEEVLICSVSPNMECDEQLKVKNECKADRCSPTQDNYSSVCKSHCATLRLIPEKGLNESVSDSQEKEKHLISVEGMMVDDVNALAIERKPGNLSGDDWGLAKENVCSSRLGSSTDKSAHDNPSTESENAYSRIQDLSVHGVLSQTAFLSRDSSDKTESKLEVRTREDSILKEARIIEAKHKRIAQLSVGAFTTEYQQKSHWDFVLEEMAWLANDFAQERLWKISAAAQLSHRVAFACRKRLAKNWSLWNQKKVAHTLSKAIMEFWLKAEELSKGMAMQCHRRNLVHGVQEYAVRFLKFNTSPAPICLTEAPATPEMISDLMSQELPLKEQFTEENLFYTVPPGAMESYRKAIESHLAQVEKTGGNIEKEVETSLYDAAAGNAFKEDEGETNTYPLSGNVESGKASKRMENKFGTQQFGLTVKGPANTIPTKRMRTASRPRFTTLVTAGTSGGIQHPNKADASSGDNSFQDDQSIFHRDSQVLNRMEAESVADFERPLPFDSAEVSKPKKKKKPKRLGPTYEQRWQLTNNYQNELGGYSRKRLGKLVESNGSSGSFCNHIIKKQRIMKQPVDNSFDSYSPLAGSLPSVASQMSNMSNSNKLIKILGGHRGRKSKSLKIPVGQTGPGSPWSSFEEQALIVLVHDLGPNWELVSDAINNILQYKCIFRKPKDCSEHHKELSRTTGDGADSAEDSGSSQSYPSTLPGIAKGSARGLFQRLQEPIEEDMIKFHFEKIISMSQKQHYLKMQNENQEQKPIQPHSSHAIALSQVCPNNVNGGSVLTPFDLCDTTVSSPDIPCGGYQGTHGGGLAISNHAGGASLSSTSYSNSSLQGSPSMMLLNNFTSPPTLLNSSPRDGRYGGPKSVSSSIDEQQRVQHYNQMMPGRVSGTPTGTDRKGRMIGGGNGVGIMCGINRNMNMARPGFPGIATSSVLNSGSMLSSNMAVMAGPTNMHSGVDGSPGNSMLRPRDPLNMIRPAQIPEHQRPMMVPDHQMQANIQGVPPLEGPSGGFSSQTSLTSSQTHPFHHHQSSPQQSHLNPQHPHLQGPNHVSSPQRQAYAIRFAKERQLKFQQQRLLQQQQLAASGGVMPRGPTPPQTSPQDNFSVQPQVSASVSRPLSPSSLITPISQHQLKTHMPPHGLTRNPQTDGNQMGKQRQRQSQQQRPHPQQNAKIVKEAGRGNMAIHQNLTVDTSDSNGVSPSTGSPSTEKAEHAMNMMQGHGICPRSGLNPHYPSNKPQVQKQKLLFAQPIALSKQAHQLPSHLENSNQGNLPTSDQTASPSVTSSNSQLLQPSQKLTSQSQSSMNSDFSPSKFLADQGQSENQNLSTSSTPSQLGKTAVNPRSSVERDTVKPVLSGAKQKQNSSVPKALAKPTPVGNSLTSLGRTQGQGPDEVQTSVTMQTQEVDTGAQASSPPQHKLQPLSAQAESSKLYPNAGSANDRLERSTFSSS